MLRVLVSGVRLTQVELQMYVLHEICVRLGVTVHLWISIDTLGCLVLNYNAITCVFFQLVGEGRRMGLGWFEWSLPLETNEIVRPAIHLFICFSMQDILQN